MKNTDIIESFSNDTLKFTSGIHSIFQDSKGNYWFGSHGEGVCLYDEKSYQYFTTENGLSENSIISIQEDKNGIIWFGTLNGVISSYNGIEIKNHNNKLSDPVQNDWMNSAIGLTQNKWTKKDSDLWFSAGIHEGVVRYDGQQFHYLPYPTSLEETPNNIYSTTAFSKGKNNMIWFATYSGVIGYDGHEFTIINDKSLGYKEQEQRVHVRSILKDSKGRLWIGNNGIGVLLKEGDEVINFSKQQGKLMPHNIFRTNTLNKEFSKNTGLQSVFAIAEDSYGNIWFGDRDTGAWKYDGKSLTNYPIDKNLSSKMIWNIYEDKNKNLLVAMAFGGVYQFNGESFSRRF